MIETNTKQNRWSKIQSVDVIVVFESLSKLNQQIKKVKTNFDAKHRFSFVVVFKDKKEKETIKLPEHCIGIASSDFNIFGKIKDSELLNKITVHESDILLVGIAEKNKFVKKLLSLKKYKLSIGRELESLPKFGLAFLMTEFNFEKLVEQAVKYLKQI